MINKSDVEARRIRWPEPKEVTGVRNLITESFKDLVFLEDSHQYFVGDREFPPVSSICHRFEPYVDWDQIAENKAQKLGRTKEDLQKEWHENNITSTSCGSKTHWFGEQMMNLFIGRDVNLPFQYSRDGYMIPYAGKERAIEKYWEDILKNPNVFPVMPEAKLYHRELGYAGTFDILLAYRMGNGDIKFSIHDYKGLPLDTPIKVKGGWKTIGTVEVGDRVYDKEGDLVDVEAVSEVHHNPCFKIVFSGGSEIIADHEHRWEVLLETRSNHVMKETEYRVMTTEAMWKRSRGVMYIEQKNPQSFLKVVRVEEVDMVPTRCLSVSSPSHTFCVGENMLVTHNTNKDLRNSFNRSKSLTLLDPFRDYISEPLSIYGIQLSLYQLGLAQLGIPIVDRNLIWLKEDGTYEKIGTPDLTGRLLNTL